MPDIDSVSTAEELYGIPQGGALSPVFANLIMMPVDEAVKAVSGSDTGYYARFCDDLLVSHPEEATCIEMFAAVLRALDRLGLRYHHANNVEVYPADYFSGKSKLPYLWSCRLPWSWQWH